MKVYKKIMCFLAGGLIITGQAQATNGNFTQLDQPGINVILELTKICNDFVKATKQRSLSFDLTLWNFLLNTNVKKYVEDYSTALGIKDKELIRNLNLLLQTNNTLTTKIKAVQNYKKPARQLNDVDRHLLTESLLKPFEQIEQNIQNVIIPTLKEQSHWVSADKRGKAKEMLIRVFDLLHQMASAMVKHTAAIIHMD